MIAVVANKIKIRFYEVLFLGFQSGVFGYEISDRTNRRDALVSGYLTTLLKRGEYLEWNSFASCKKDT